MFQGRGYILTLTSLVLLGVSDPVQAFQVGNPVASFFLQGLDGKVYHPGSYRGKVLVLFFLGHS